MFDFESILAANPIGVLATQEGDKVRTRVFHYKFADGNKVYFCTDNTGFVYTQLKANPNVSFCTYPPDYTPVVSINGKAVFVEDLALKTRAFEVHPSLKDRYQTPENPIFKIFYIAVEEVRTYSATDGRKTYNL
jgi:uncharacterized pyridoxamine 5'-phosphate oxidase family protein